MNIIVAGEESGVTRDAFAALGHNSWSCDLDANMRHQRFTETDAPAKSDRAPTNMRNYGKRAQTSGGWNGYSD